jgi:hypothetical protein
MPAFTSSRSVSAIANASLERAGLIGSTLPP